MEDASEEDMTSNANYVISVARKLGACVFITPEDITEVKPKMIFSFIASLWVEKLKKGPDDGKVAASRGLSPPRSVTPPRPAAAAAAQPPPPPPPPAAAAPVAAAAPPAPPPKPIALPTGDPSPAAPVSAPTSSGFQSINGSGEKGGVYGGVSGGDAGDVDEDEWD